MIAVTAAFLGCVFMLAVALYHPRYLAPISLAVGVLACRPSAVGERWPWLGPVIIFVGVVLTFLTPMRDAPARKVPVWPAGVVFFLGYLWLILRESLVGDDAFSLVSSSGSVFLPVFAFLLTVLHPEVQRKASNVVVWLVTASSASVVVSMAMGLVVGYGALRMGTLPIGYERIGSGLMFPFSLTYGSGSDGVTRFLGLGREPGMGAIFIGYAFFAMPVVRFQNTYRAILLVALAGTLSTAGIGLFAVALGLHFVVGSRKRSLLIRAAAVGASVWAINIALYDTRFGFLSKQDTVSNLDRTRATNAGIEAFVTDPFLSTTDMPLSSINMVAGIALTGAPWFLLMLAYMAAPVLYGGMRRWQTYAGGFILVTMLTSQPLYGSTGIMLLVAMLLSSIRAEAAEVTDAGSTTEEPSKPGRPMMGGGGRTASARYRQPVTR